MVIDLLSGVPWGGPGTSPLFLFPLGQSPQEVAVNIKNITNNNLFIFVSNEAYRKYCIL